MKCLYFQSLYLKSIFEQIRPKSRNSSDFLKNLNSRYFEGVDYKSDIGIIRFFIQDINLNSSKNESLVEFSLKFARLSI